MHGYRIFGSETSSEFVILLRYEMAELREMGRVLYTHILF